MTPAEFKIAALSTRKKINEYKHTISEIDSKIHELREALRKESLMLAESVSPYKRAQVVRIEESDGYNNIIREFLAVVILNQTRYYVFDFRPDEVSFDGVRVELTKLKKDGSTSIAARDKFAFNIDCNKLNNEHLTNLVSYSSNEYKIAEVVGTYDFAAGMIMSTAA